MSFCEMHSLILFLQIFHAAPAEHAEMGFIANDYLANPWITRTFPSAVDLFSGRVRPLFRHARPEIAAISDAPHHKSHGQHCAFLKSYKGSEARRQGLGLVRTVVNPLVGCG